MAIVEMVSLVMTVRYNLRYLECHATAWLGDLQVEASDRKSSPYIYDMSCATLDRPSLLLAWA